MLNKLKETANAARLRFGAWNRERRERAAEKRASALQSEHGHGRFFLLHVPATATICAAIVEWYWALLFCIEATGHIDWNYETAFGSQTSAQALWNFAFSAHWPVLAGLVCATVPIVMLSMVWLPVQFAMRGTGRWRRGTVILVGILANVLVIVSGTVVMNYNRQEQVREALVVQETAAANRGAIQAQIDAVSADLARLTDRRINNEYAATAANVGAEAYRAQYMSEEALRRSPEQRRDIIVRALGAAERADALRAERTALFQQLAQAPTEAAVAANVEDTVGRELNAFAQYVEVWRPPFVALICTLIGIFGAWWVLALMQGLNPRDVLRSGWADEAHRIEDLREQEAVTPQPMDKPREAVFDAETGEELVPVKATWRRKPKRKGKAEQVEIAPEIPPDETGVAHDGGGRMASEPRHVPDLPSPEDDAANREPDAQAEQAQETEQGEAVQSHDGDAVDVHSEITLSDEETLALEALDSEGEEDQQSEEIALPEGEGVMLQSEEPEREPETDPSKLIAAE